MSAANQVGNEKRRLQVEIEVLCRENDNQNLVINSLKSEKGNLERKLIQYNCTATSSKLGEFEIYKKQ